MQPRLKLLFNWQLSSWSLFWLGLLGGAIAVLISFSGIAQPGSIADSALPLVYNWTVIENQRPGTKDWQLTNPATRQEIEGYASLTSVNRGQSIQLFVNTAEPSYTLEVFRLGWYGGTGARRMTAAIAHDGVKQPAATLDLETGMVECNWRDPIILTIPDTEPQGWTSGVYLTKLTARQSGKQSYIMFVVRDDARRSNFLFQSSVTTFQAYNNWGGKSLYRWNSQGSQAIKVSFNRPYARSPNLAAAYGIGAGEFLTNVQPARRTSSSGWEINLLRWLEREGYDVTYVTDVDTHADPNLLLPHQAFLVVGHDEYWSWKMRQHVEAARDRGVSLGFFGANICFWQIRFEPSLINYAPNRTMVAYKESAALDPFARDRDAKNDHLVTTYWRAKPVNRPEDALIGVMYETFQVNDDIVIDTHRSPSWLLDKTNMKPADSSTTQTHWLPGLLGYEVDRMFGNAPVNTLRIAHSPYLYKGGTRYADMTIYTAKSGATVFATGSMQWSWGLDDYNVPQLRPSRFNPTAQQITRNILAKMLDSQSAKT